MKESEADGICNRLAFSKPSEVVCAHEKMMKDGVSLRDNLHEADGGMFIYAPHVVIIHQEQVCTMHRQLIFLAHQCSLLSYTSVA